MTGQRVVGSAKPSGPESGAVRSSFTVRSYELDSFGHLNHAVFLNLFEQARFDALEVCGWPVQRVLDRGWGVYVTRIEVDYLAEVHWGDRLEVETWVEGVRRSTMTLRQSMTKADGIAVASAKVVGVWVGEDRRPLRMPDQLREGLQELRGRPRTPPEPTQPRNRGGAAS